VYSYDEPAQAISLANSLPYAFQASVFSNRLDFAMQAYRGLDASAVMMNDHTAFRVDWMPFAGRRHSGYGIGGIGHTMKDMTHEKMMVLPMT
jgi:acyl-CoA reductase-like NAD-dependent aldehyde dehydrogenase